MAAREPAVALFAPHPLLTVTIETEGPELHAGGQGVWVAGMVRCMGAKPIFCALLGGEPGELLRPLLAQTVGAATHPVSIASASGCYVVDHSDPRHREAVGEVQRTVVETREDVCMQIDQLAPTVSRQSPSGTTEITTKKLAQAHASSRPPSTTICEPVM